MANWDFSDDESFFTFVAGATTAFGAFRWYFPLVATRTLRTTPTRGLLFFTPPLCLLAVYYSLRNWSDPVYVAGHFDYTVLFMLGGGALLTLVATLLPLTGVHPVYDALERRNSAAGVFVMLTLLGAAALYAGANVGAGPTIWTTLFPAAVSTAGYLAALLLLCLSFPLPDTIAIDRDLAGGLRNGVVMLCLGLIFGRAAAGDWTAWASTFSDLVGLSWPALVLMPVALLLNHLFRPTPNTPAPSVSVAGIFPALLLLLFTVGYLVYLGPATIGKHVITYEEYLRSR